MRACASLLGPPKSSCLPKLTSKCTKMTPEDAAMWCSKRGFCGACWRCDALPVVRPSCSRSVRLKKSSEVVEQSDTESLQWAVIIFQEKRWDSASTKKEKHPEVCRRLITNLKPLTGIWLVAPVLRFRSSQRASSRNPSGGSLHPTIYAGPILEQ